jgi:inner membrane transporter RhtA
MAMTASVLPYSLELAAMRRASKRVFGILLSLEPAIATAAGWLLLGQHAGPAALAAIIIVIAASTGSALGDKSRRPGDRNTAQQSGATRITSRPGEIAADPVTPESQERTCTGDSCSSPRRLLQQSLY